MSPSDIPIGKVSAWPSVTRRLHGSAAFAHLCFAFCLGIGAVPLLAAETLPLFDYANHLARVHVIDRWQDSAAFQAHFEVASFLIPNVLADVVLLALTPLAGVEGAGRMLLLLTFALTLGGNYALNRQVTGRFGIWPLFAAVFLYHEMFFWGFLNYILGLALIPWALFAWLAMEGRGRGPQIVLGAAFALTIFFAHLVAFGLHAVAIATLELWRAWRQRHHGPARIARRLAVSAAQFIPALALYAAVSPSRNLPTDFLYDYSAWGKLSPFARLLSSGNPPADLTALALVAGAVLLGLVSGRLRLHGGLALTAGAFLALVLALPYSALQSYFLDSRIAIAVAFMLLAGLVPTAAGRRPAPMLLAAALLLALVASRSYMLVQDWAAQSRDYAEVIGAFDRLPPGSLLAAASGRWFELGDWTSTRRTWPAHEHTAGYAAIRRDVVVPNLFAKPGQNPLVFTPPLPEIAALGRNPIPRAMHAPDFAWLIGQAAAAADYWRQRAAVPGVYLIVYHRRCQDWPAHPRLRPVACGADFSLMRVAAAGGAAP